MSVDKDSKILRRWLVLIVSTIVAGGLSIIIDIMWIKKTLWVILLFIGFVAAGSVYEFYESWLNNLDKKSDKK
ncbi:hypothetical protein [Mesobacillus sp.]|uniref:hypothetical protein n=1 Tax=Mesobacillus sp. TaxID=2675271 RepID=UPI0039EF027D